ncbi:MAG: flagellar biosynthesis anti-sigma factor FlgM [Dehalococcoidia bacterium]|nr:flagellar biosynthesis anti-sigma factor FlgM [Dehalococcoidia bacterium]
MLQPIRPQDATGVYQRQVLHAAQTEASQRRDAPGAARAARRSDQVSLSTEARDLQRLMRQVAELPEGGEERIAFLRQQVESGDYRVDAAELAQRMAAEGLL